jgi:hypothetical protein
MNNAAGKEWYGVGLDTTQFQQGADRVTQGFNKIDQQASKSGASLESSFKKGAVALGAMFTVTAAAGIIGNIAKVRGEFQQLEIAFTTMLGSEKASRALMAQMTKTAAETPFDLTQVASGAKQLLAYGFNVEKVNDTLITLGDVASGVSAPLNDIVYLYGTLRASGRVMQIDIRQFANRGIPIYEELAKVLKVNVSEINELVRAGQVGFPHVEEAFKNMTSEGGRFNDLMKKQADSIVGLKSNLKDAADMAKNELGKKLEPAFESLLRGGIEVTKNLNDIGRVVMELIALYGAYRASLIVINAMHSLNIKIMRQAVLEKKLAAMGSVHLSNAEAIAAARTKMLAIAQQGLIKSLKAASAALLANPYILVAAAIAAMGFAIYMVVTHQNEMEKATERLNKASKESEKNSLGEQRELVRLNAELAATKKGTAEFEAAKDKIIKKYGQYDKTLADEIDRVGTLEGKYLSLTASIQQSYDARQYDKFMEEQGAALDETMSDNLSKLYEKLTKQLGQETGSKFYSEIKMALMQSMAEGESLQTTLSKEMKDFVFGYSKGSYDNPAIMRFVGNISEAIVATKAADKQAKELFGVIATGGGTTDGAAEKGPLASILQQITELKAGIIEAESILKDMRKGESLSTVEDIDKQVERIEELKKQLETLTGTTPLKATTDKTSKQELNDRLAAILEAKKKIAEAEIYAEYEIWQGKIGVMAEGHAKQRAQIELNYQRQTTENRRLAEQMVKDQQEIERAQWETSNQDWKKKDLIFTPTTQGVAQLSGTQQGQLSAKDQQAIDERAKAEQGLSAELLKQYQDYTAQRISIEKQFNEAIADLQVSRTAENATATDAAIAEAKKQMTESLADIDFEQFQDTGLWKQMFGDLEKVGTSTLKSILAQAKAVNSTAWNPEDLKEYQDAIEKLEDTITNRNPFRALGESWGDMVEAMKSGDADAIKSSAEKLTSSIDTISGDLTEIGDGIGSLFGEDAGYAAENIAGLIGGVGELGKGVAQLASGDIIGGIASVLKGLGKIFTIFKKIREQNEAIREEIYAWRDAVTAGEREYQALLRERLRIEQQIGELALQYHQRITSELEKQKEATSKTYSNTLAELQKLEYISGQTNIHGTLFRKAKVENNYGSLNGKSYAELERLYTQGKLEEQAAKLFEQLRDLKAEGADIDQMLADSALAFSEALSGMTFDSMRDSFSSFMEDGKVSADETADYMEDAFREAIINSLIIQRFDPLLKELVDKIWAAVEDGSFTERLDEFKTNAAALGADMNSALAPFNDLFDAMDKGQEAAKNAFATMSQDTGDELNGRFTALQMSGERSAVSLAFIQVDLADVRKTSLLAAEYTLELRDISLSGLDQLTKIAKNTNELYVMNDRLNKIEENTRGL